MKRIAILWSLIPAFVLAFNNTGEFRGQGTWKSPEGETGTWKEITTVKKGEKGMEVHTDLKVLKDGSIIHTEVIDMLLVDKPHGFFDITVTDKLVGHGYCFGPTCHYESTSNEETSEETIHFRGTTAHKMGSASGKTPPWRVAWTGNLEQF